MSNEIETTEQLPVGQQGSDGRSDLTRMVVWGLALSAGFAVFKQWPDIQRYLKMRSM